MIRCVVISQWVLAGVVAMSQPRETIDITTFTPPSGWIKQIRDNVVSYSTIDQKTGAWAQIEIHRGIESTGNAIGDFEREWKYLMRSRFEGIATPVPDSISKDGWTEMHGTSRFLWQNKESNATLHTFTGYGYVVCVSVLNNTQQFNKQIDQVINSLSLSKP